MTTYWCEHAWLGGHRAADGVLVEVEGDRFGAVTPGVPRPATAVHLPGLTVPGLANCHSHAFHRGLRGRTQAGNGSFWTWRDQMYGLAERLTPDTYFELARAVYGEMAMAGITAVGEFHYLHHGRGGVPYADPNAMSVALAAAATEAGVRLTLLDTLYLHGGIGADGSATAPNEVQRRFSDGSAGAWATRVEAFSSPGVVVGAAVHSVRAVDPSSIAEAAAWAAGRSAVLHAHVSEQPAENAQCLAATGLTPTALLHRHGALSERFTAVHATHLDSESIALLGAQRCTICMCPTTERDLADGIGPAQALRAAGAALSLGSDSHAVIDLLEEARAVELDERLASNERGRHSAASLLEAATNHASIGRADAGRIAPGMVADLVTVDLTSVRTAGTGPAVEAAVFAASAADVRHVVAGGRVVVRDGSHTSLDVGRELARTVAAAQGDA